MRVTEKKTKIERLRGNLRAETITTVNNQTFEISTFKSRGVLVSNALPIKAAQNGSTEIISFDFNDLTNKKILLIKEECSRATEKAIKAQHFKALAVFDEMYEKGEIQPNTPQEVQVKDIIFLDGYGKYKGSEGNKYVVYEIEKTTFGTVYKTVELDTLTIRTYDRVKPYSEKFGIGMYFEKGYCFEGSQDELNNIILDAVENEKLLKVKKEEEEKKEAELLKVETEKLLNQYNYLTPVKAKVAKNEEQQTKINVLTELKRSFPGVKFSMKKSEWRSYRLSWTDGPTRDEIENLLNKYIGYSFSECGDYYDPNTSLFNDVFGYFKFFFFDREMSKQIETLKEEFNKDINNRENYVFSKIYQNTSIPVGANTFKIEEGESYNSKSQSYFKLTFVVPESQEIKDKISLELISYSTKSVAVIGNTKPIKEELKELGGRFNPKLKCGAGWIFPKSKETLIKKIFNL